MTYHRHEKSNGPPTMRVDYRCGFVWHSEWICFQHTGYPRQKACTWWNKRAPGVAVPATVSEALKYLDGTLIKEPIGIQVKPVGKYTEIVAYQFGE